jgi:filamentous hemagglutinin
LTWALTNPDKAVATGLLTVETAAALASGAVAPGSIADGLGNSLGRGLTAADEALVRDLALTLKAVAQQRSLSQQPQRLGELANMFKKDASESLLFGGQHMVANSQSNLAGTTKIFNTSAVKDEQLQTQVFNYAYGLTGGLPLTPPIKNGTPVVGVWTASLPDGTIVNVRSVSSSAVARWTIDVIGSPIVKAATNTKAIEVKFK